MGAVIVRDIQAGEMVIIRGDQVESIMYSEKTRNNLCSFEYIYFARPDSVIDGISVHKARMNLGRKLFEEHPMEADVVIGVPDSGLAAAHGYSLASGNPFDLGFNKNKTADLHALPQEMRNAWSLSSMPKRSGLSRC